MKEHGGAGELSLLTQLPPVTPSCKPKSQPSCSGTIFLCLYKGCSCSQGGGDRGSHCWCGYWSSRPSKAANKAPYLSQWGALVMNTGGICVIGHTIFTAETLQTAVSSLRHFSGQPFCHRVLQGLPTATTAMDILTAWCYTQQREWQTNADPDEIQRKIN